MINSDKHNSPLTEDDMFDVPLNDAKSYVGPDLVVDCDSPLNS